MTEREKLLAKLREKYAELEPCKFVMSPEDRERFEELGELIEMLEREGGDHARH
jgi:hypothetical protein